MMPVVHKAYKKYKAKGFVVLSVSIDEKPAFKSFVKAHPFANPVILDDGKTANAWGVTGIPAFFIVKNGKILDKKLGGSSPAAFDAWIKKYVK